MECILMKSYIITIPHIAIFTILGIAILGGSILYFKKSKNKK
ncbi:LPXTG cell wall anchor domain-containing protein [Romboutsia maritimum]|uniref:LPXTG cell wall anchor domain-containing protein n=1 Tax=Romboutsia maritimum TaxID=2020948 RepID=A0A371IQE7_9FIRM|nr:LPXTG cell wall anchor domain-containing protein [Romboutsia maritimum]